MRVLLDECIPRRLKRELPGYEVKTVQEMGWGGLKNGRLLAAAGGQIDVFVTVDLQSQFSTKRSESGRRSDRIASEKQSI